MPNTEFLSAHVQWRKSRYSDQQGACVEVAVLNDTVGVRDSKDPHGPILTLTRTTAATLAEAIRAGDHDL